MKTRLQMLVILGCWMITGFAVEARPVGIRLAGDLSPEKLLAQEDLQQFLSADDAEDLHRFIRTWKHPIQELRRTGSLDSARQERDMPHYLIVLEDYYLKSSIQDLLLFPKTTGSLKTPAGIIETPHDLSLVEGRTIWALEQLLGIELPPVTQQGSPEHAQARMLVFEEWKRRMLRRKAFLFLLIKSSLPTTLEEKLALVNEPTTPFMVVDALAQDRLAAVRLATVHYPHLNIHVFKRLVHDPDDAVHEAAESIQYRHRRGIDILAAQKTEAMTSFLSRYPIKTVFEGQEQPALLPFDLAIEEHLTAMRASWTAAASVETGPQTLAEAVELLVKTLKLTDYPAFCTEDTATFYCSASTSLEPGADLNAGFAIEKGGTTIYSLHASQQ